MGISNLLQNLKFCTTKGNVSSFQGRTLVVDASSWLHKSVYMIAEHYVECYERGSIDNKCCQRSAKYITSRLQELLEYAGVAKIVLVMDGQRCPLKAVTNQEREQRRRNNVNQARKLKRQGNQAFAEDKYKACIKVSNELTRPVMRIVRQNCLDKKLNVNFVWAPYEADAQLVRCCMDGNGDAIVTEDSDVLVYLAACNARFPVLFKLDRNCGECEIISMNWLLDTANNTHNFSRKGGGSMAAMSVHLNGMRFRQKKNPGQGARQFVQACVLAGCDYAPSMLKGVGLVTAFKHVQQTSVTAPPERLFQELLSGLRRAATVNIDIPEYQRNLAKSEAVFYYHPVKSSDNKVTTLLSPRRDGDDVNQVNTWYPDLGLFTDGLSFLGKDHFLNELWKGLRSSPPLQDMPVEEQPENSSSNNNGCDVSTTFDNFACEGGGDVTRNQQRGGAENRIPTLPKAKSAVLKPIVNPYKRNRSSSRKTSNPAKANKAGNEGDDAQRATRPPLREIVIEKQLQNKTNRGKDRGKKDSSKSKTVNNKETQHQDATPTADTETRNWFNLDMYRNQGDIRGVKRIFPSSQSARSRLDSLQKSTKPTATTSRPSLVNVSTRAPQRTSSELAEPHDRQSVQFKADDILYGSDKDDTEILDEPDDIAGPGARPYHKTQPKTSEQTKRSTYFANQQRDNDDDSEGSSIHEAAKDQCADEAPQSKQGDPWNDDDEDISSALGEPPQAHVGVSSGQCSVFTNRSQEKANQSVRDFAANEAQRDDIKSSPCLLDALRHHENERTCATEDDSSVEDLQQEETLPYSTFLDQGHSSRGLHTEHRRSSRGLDDRMRSVSSDFDRDSQFVEAASRARRHIAQPKQSQASLHSSRFPHYADVGESSHQPRRCASPVRISDREHYVAHTTVDDPFEGELGEQDSRQPRGFDPSLRKRSRCESGQHDDEDSPPTYAQSHYFASKKQRGGRRVTLEKQTSTGCRQGDTAVVDLSHGHDNEVNIQLGHDFGGGFDYCDYDAKEKEPRRLTIDPLLDHDQSESLESPSPPTQPAIRTTFNPPKYRNPMRKQKARPSPLLKAFETQRERYASSTPHEIAPRFSLSQIQSLSNHCFHKKSRGRKASSKQQNSVLGYPGFGPLTIQVHERHDDGFMD